MVLFCYGWAPCFVGCLGCFYAEGKIALNDFPRIIAAAFFGVAFNMLTFFLRGYFPYLGIRDYGDHPDDCINSFNYS
jgi:hypothetical protein